MAVETLKLQITADNKEAVAALQATNNQLAKFQRALKSATDPSQVQYLQRNIDFLNAKIGNMKTAMGTAGQAVQKSKANFTELSRVIQDLPFGFTAISNNLTQLIPGVGALGLAFSGLVAALTFSQVGFTAWGAKTKKAKEEADKLNQSIAEENTNLRSLYIVATNANVPIDARRKAVKDLRDQYGSYFQDLTDEQIMLGKAKTAYESLTAAIVKNAKAQAAKSKITELSAEVLKQEEKIANLREQAEKAGDGGAIAAGGRNIGGYQKFTDAVTLQAERLAFLRGEANKAREAIDALNKQISFYEKTILDNTTKPFTEDLKEGAKEASKEVVKLSDLLEKAKNAVIGAKVGSLSQMVSQPIDRTRPGQGQLGQAQETGFQRLVEYQRGLMATDEALRLYNEYAAEAASITGVFSSAFTDLGTALLQGQSLGAALGNVFRKLAADIAAAAVKALIFKAILGAISGGGATAIGALGGAKTDFGSIFGRFLGLRMATGGITQGPTPALIGEAGPEAVLPLDKLRAFVDRAARIGADSMRGGSQGMNITGEFVARGQDLVLALNRAGYNLSLRR